MPTTHLSSLVIFAFVSGITPGPNNIMVMSSGVNFGLRPSLPHVAGTLGGIFLVMLLAGEGVNGLLHAFPWLYNALRFAALLYMLYLAWRIAATSTVHEGGKATRPLTFLQAAAFQWVNPKVWAVGLAAITTFARPAHLATDVVAVAAVVVVTSAPNLLIWTVFGTLMRRALSSPGAARFFNLTMAILLVLSLVPALVH